MTVTVPCEKRRLGGDDPDGEIVLTTESCTITVLDNGEPGQGTDVFLLTDPSGYTSDTIAGGDILNKGNIQAHYEEADEE